MTSIVSKWITPMFLVLQNEEKLHFVMVRWSAAFISQNGVVLYTFASVTMVYYFITTVQKAREGTGNIFLASLRRKFENNIGGTNNFSVAWIVGIAYQKSLDKKCD
jgi:hypothetical protein